MPVPIATRRRYNEHRRRLFRDVDRQIAFLCECDDDTCTRSVLLTPQLFDELREKQGTLVHPGHLEE